MANGTKPTKPGYKTTEFWVTLVIQVIGIAVLFGWITPEQRDTLVQAVQQGAAAIAMALSAFGYAVARGKAKAGENKN